MTTPNQQPRKAFPLGVGALVGVAALALLTWAAYRVHARPTTAAVLYLGVIVLVALRGNLVAALLVAIGGTASLAYFFIQPVFSFRLSEPGRDVIALAIFSATAIVITRLVTALRASEARWRNAFENNPTMYFMVDPAGTVLSVNPFGASELGYTVEELVGRSVLDLFPEDAHAAASDHLARCLARVGESITWELRKVRKDGTGLWVRETARAVRQTADRPVVLIACEDITSQREAQDRLRQSEARLRSQASLLDLAHDAIFVRDLNNVITYWNRGAEELYGWSSEETLGKVTHELLRTVFPEPLSEIAATVLETGRWEGELVHTKRDGTRVVVASRWSLQRDARGNPAGVLETNDDVTERKRAEEELRRSEAFLAEAQRLSHTGSFGWKVATGGISWSEETYRIFGYDRSTTPSVERIVERTHPDDRAAVQSTIERAQGDARDFEHEYRLLLPDGTAKHLHVMARAVTSESGELEFVGAVMDVTDRERAAEALRRSEAYLAEAQRVSHTGSWAWNVRTKQMVHWSDEQFRTYGIDPADGIPSWEALGRLTHPDDRARVSECIGRAVYEKSDCALDYRTVLPDGTMKYIHSVGHPVLDASGELVEFVGTEMDVTAQRKAEEERLLVLRDLRESAQRYQNIFQMAAVSIWEEDFSRVKAAIDELRAGGVEDFRRYFAEHPEFVARTVGMVRIVDVNDATVTLFGARSKEELIGSLHEVFTPDTLSVFAAELLAVAEGRTSFAAETTLRTLRGERLDVLFTIAFPAEQTTLESVLVSIMDVTARRRAEEALQRAQAELGRVGTLTTMGEIAASIAHELRQPLAAISMNGSAALRWLNRENPDLAEARAAASRTVREAQRADEVIRSLRALLGKATLQRGMVDVTDAILEVLELVRGELRRHEVSVRTDIPPSLPPAFGDRVQLQQVLLNLIVNGVEAMDAVTDRPRALVIRAERAEPGMMVVAVEDTGPGLDPATAARVFDPFYTTKPTGLGLGLSICRSIVETHGGQLLASPRTPFGTAFRFTVPTMASAAAAAAADAKGKEPALRA